MGRLVYCNAFLFVAVCVLSLGVPSAALSWTSPLNLSNDAGASQMPAITVGSDGTVHAVWTDVSTLEMMYSSRSIGGSWTAPEVVATYANTTSFMDGDIVVAVGPDETLHILYADDSSGSSEVYYRSKALGGTWSTPANVSQTPGNRSEMLNVAISPDGTVHAAWITTPGCCAAETYYASKAPGESWTTGINISNSSANEYPTRLGVGPDNSVHVVTSQEDGGPGQQNIYYYSKPAGGSFSAGENLTGTANVGRGMGGVLKTGDGTVHVLYYEGPTPVQVIYMNKPACGSWSGPVNVSNSSSSSWDAAMAADGCGNLHVSWIDDGGGAQKIQHTTRTTDGNWTAAVDITGGATSANSPRLAVASPTGITTGIVEVAYSNAPSGNPDVFFTEASLTACQPPVVTAVTDRPITPSTGLGQSYPNPFNPDTSIPIVLSHPGHVRIDVYSAEGARVRNLIDENRQTGEFSVRWDGRDDRGNPLATGVYFYSLAIDGKVVAAKKAVMLK